MESWPASERTFDYFVLQCFFHGRRVTSQSEADPRFTACRNVWSFDGVQLFNGYRIYEGAK